MSQRDYNHVYTAGPFILQALQDGQHDGIAIGLLPQITLAGNNGRCVFAIGFDWLCGTVNVGIMTPEFRESERKRIECVKEQAAKLGITQREMELRWGW